MYCNPMCSGPLPNHIQFLNAPRLHRRCDVLPTSPLMLPRAHHAGGSRTPVLRNTDSPVFHIATHPDPDCGWGWREWVEYGGDFSQRNLWSRQPFADSSHAPRTQLNTSIPDVTTGLDFSLSHRKEVMDRQLIRQFSSVSRDGCMAA